MSSTHNACRMVNVHANVALRNQHWLPCVDAHTHSHRYAFGPHMCEEEVLCHDCRRHGIASVSKSYEEGISLCIYLMPVPPTKRAPQQVAALCEQKNVLVA